MSDTIELSLSWLHHHANLPQQEGLLVILDLVLDRPGAKVPFEEGSRVRVRKPDETLCVHEVKRVEVNPVGGLGLFFSKLTATEIPRGSVIELLDAAPS